ncbi:hypothetical protein [Nocardia terrae]|uniref:hypothetical protein n=1 Tax=Nocardia terrae TaxID=2675851 RepID=UPI001F2D4514|nr:hypothetical protein [Nocardia terrae]
MMVNAHVWGVNAEQHGRRDVGGELAISDESIELCFVAPADLGTLDMHHTQRLGLSTTWNGGPRLTPAALPRLRISGRCQFGGN